MMNGSNAIGGDVLDFVGNTFSSSRRFWMDDMTESMYVGAERETCLPACVVHV